MLVDAKKLRWVGIGMRPRWRRRVAVVLSYVVFLVVVWLHPWRIDRMPMVLFVGMNLSLWDQLMKDSIGTIARRSLLGAMFVGVAWLYWKHPAKPDRMICDIYALLWIASLSAVAYGRLVDAVWMRSSVRRWLRTPRRLHTLDEFARHYYGESFGALTEEEQIEVGRRERANPMGEWVMGGGRFPVIEDERVRHEDDRVRAQAQRLMTWVLVGSAAAWNIASVSHHPFSNDTVTAWAWTVAGLSMTLRQTIVLWTEDPHAGSDEIEMVQGQEA